MIKKYHSNGKLLLSGEYAVMEGALALAVPTRYGQSMTVTSIEAPQLVWSSFDVGGEIWYEAIIPIDSLILPQAGRMENPIQETLVKLLAEAVKLNPSFLNKGYGYQVTTQLDFPRDWGLGTSSTLINNIAQWAEVDAYALLRNAFTGSGYDIACARHNVPILYRLCEDLPIIEEVFFDPPFKNDLYFVHLNKKQDSREGIAQYGSQTFDRPKLVREISEITKKILTCQTLVAFQALMVDHENLLSAALRLQPVKALLFSDYNGCVKSLGAWGGDFVLAFGHGDTPSYFKEKGYEIIIPYTEMVL
tara:strand:+ start:2943 stop:3857 length:915 start_codon:yes stop_codon:yes gene_type:complete